MLPIKMNHLRFVIFVLVVFLLSSCTGNTQKKINEGDTELAQNEISPQPDQENFHLFLHDFSADRIFQLERIVFPITVSIPDANEIALSPTPEKIEKSDWELLDLSYDSTYITRDYDKYTQTVQFRKDTAHVSLRGIDNGIYADYYFKLLDGKWYLVTLVE